MSAARRIALAKLETIGGEVSEEEIAYHLGDEAVLDPHEAETEGLVITRTTFELTERGRKTLVGEAGSQVDDARRA